MSNVPSRIDAYGARHNSESFLIRNSRAGIILLHLIHTWSIIIAAGKIRLLLLDTTREPLEPTSMCIGWKSWFLECNRGAKNNC